MTVEELDLARAKDMCPIIGEGTSCLQGRGDRDPCNKDNCMSVRAARASRLGDEARGLRVVPVALLGKCGNSSMNCPHALEMKAYLAASPFAPEPEEKG